MATNLCQRLGDFVAGFDYRDLPGVVVAKARYLVLDSLGCALGASRTEVGRMLREAATPWGGRGEKVTVLGEVGLQGSVAGAVFLGTTLANALDFDDTYYGHPGAVIVPTALALSELTGASGEEFLTAVVLGYELAIRIAKATNPTPKQRVVLWGIGSRLAPAAGAVASRLLRLPADKVAQAIAIAAANAPLASVNKTVYGKLGPSLVKNNMGMAALAGAVGAHLAQTGYTGPLDILEGETGFWRMVGSDRFESETVAAGLGSRYDIMQVNFKPYPCCRFIHAPLDATLSMKGGYGLDPDHVEDVEVRTFSWVANESFRNRAPTSMPEAQFSIPYCLSVALLGYPAGPDWFAPDVLKDLRVRTLAKAVRVEPWPEADSRSDEAWLADVRIKSGGQTYRWVVEYPTGHPKNPMTTDTIEQKFLTLAGPVLGSGRAEEVMNTVLRVETLASVETLVRALTPVFRFE